MKIKRCLKQSIYIFLFILLICYGCSLATLIILYFSEFKDNNLVNNKNDTRLIFIGTKFIITNIIVKSIIFVSTTVFACYFNCFLSQGILVFYIFSLMIMLAFELPSFFILLENILNNKNQFIGKILFIFILNIFELICNSLSIIFCLFLRNIIIEEIEQSPLNFIGLDMTEDKYINILKKSGTYKRKIDNNDDNNDYE